MKISTFARIVLPVMLAAFFGTSAMAQDISSKARGTVTDETGNPISGASVVITHEPTGTTRSVSTDGSGSFFVRGLRVGGPYTVEFSASGHRGASYENVQLTLTDTADLSVSLEGTVIEEIVTTARRMDQMIQTGSESTFNEQFIRESTAFNRDLKEIVARNPLAVILPGSDAPLTIAGMNPKYNSLTVDGVVQNDDFGLNDNGYPTQRAPISLETVEQLSVQVSPFSPRYGGFSGGQINAVTKSGGNDFSGSIFYEDIDSARSGTPKRPDGTEVDLDFKEETYGGYLSGPIIRDRLFFLASYEKFEEPLAIEWGPEGSNAPNQSRVTQAEMDEIISIANSVYDVNPGTWNLAPPQEDEKILFKLDLNINDDHRAALTYQFTEGNLTRNQSTSSSELRLSSHWYNKAETLESYAFHLFSNWTDRFSTELKVVDKTVKTVQAASDLSFGDVTITTANGRLALGPDQFRHANRLNNGTTQFVLHGEYFLGDHVIAGGVDYTELDVFNLFVDGSLGVWNFDSIDDFRNRRAAGWDTLPEFFNGFDYRNAFTNVAEDGGATFNIDTLALYIEDRWQATDNLNVSFGLRYEKIGADASPRQNQKFFDRYGFYNDENLDGADNLLPRIGLDYVASDKLRLYGGVGKYSGGRPTVWISNGYTNDGIIRTTFDRTAVNPADYLTNVDITTIPQSVKNNMLAADGNTTPVQPGFEVPSDWRYKFGVEYNAFDDYLFNFEFLRIEADKSVHWTDLARVQVGETADGGRPIYAPFDPLDPLGTSNRYDLLLRNADGGWSNIISLSMNKRWDNGLSIYSSYTNQNTEEGNPGTSSRAESNYQFNAALDRQFPTFGPTSYEIEHRFTVDLRYAKQFFGEYETRFNLYFQRRSGTPWSWTLGSFRDGDLGDQTDFDDSDYYLPYIPTGASDPNVVYSGGLTYDALLAEMQKVGVDQYAGGYVPKNTGRTPWVTRLDFRVEQEIPGFSRDHRGMIYLEVLNFLNLLDSDKGKVLRNQFSTSSRILVDYDVNSSGQYVYRVPFGGWNTDANWDFFDAPESQWRLKLGLRYRF